MSYEIERVIDWKGDIRHKTKTRQESKGGGP